MSYTGAVFYMDAEGGSDTARTALTVCTASNPSGSITSIAKTGHGLVTGAVVDLTLFSAWLNAAWKITVTDANNFTLDGAVWQATADTSGTTTPRGGSSKTDAWRSFSSGATAARTQGGDTVRVMGSPDPTSLGITATWTNLSATVTLASAVTANISDCETAWTASANVTSTADTGIYRENTKSAKHVIAAGFTTGLVSFFATGTLDLSAYQQVSFWVQQVTGAVAASTLSLRLCSDVAGVTTVHTIPIPAMPNGGTWVPITWDNGGALNSAIKSVALYADADPGAVTVQLDNIIACKASSAADSLTLNSLIGKKWNQYWTASATYAANDIVKPTPAYRNGLRYKVTAGGGGAAGGTEPTWPTAIGVTVTDGALTWTCEGLEDTWYPIASINGTTVILDNNTPSLPTAFKGYPGATETVTTYKREPILQVNLSGGLLALISGAMENLAGDGTTAEGYLTYSCGWNRTDMTTRTGETWRSGQNNPPFGFKQNVSDYFQMDGLGIVRCVAAWTAVAGNYVLSNCHFNGNTQGIGWASGNTLTDFIASGVVCNNNGSSHGIQFNNNTGRIHFYPDAVQACSNIGSGIAYLGDTKSTIDGNVLTTINNGASGITFTGGAIVLYNWTSNNNVTAGLTDVSNVDTILVNCNITDTTPIVALTAGQDHYIFAQKWNATTDNHLITTDGGTISSSTSQRNTASGISWLFSPTNVNRDFTYPLKLSVAKIKCAANAAVSITIYTRRDSTNIAGTLKVAGGQLAGIGKDIEVACAPSINTWTQSSTLSFTPTESGVVEVTFEVYDGVGTTNSFWIDDLAVT